MRLLAAALAAASVALSVVAEPVEATAVFKMSWNGIPIAESTDTLEFSGGRYKISSAAVAIGLAAAIGQKPIDRFSEGAYGEDGFLAPERYEHVRDGKSRISVIDRAAGEVRINTEGAEKTEELTGDRVHDNLSLAYNFYATGSAPERGGFHLTDGRRLTDVEFVAVGDGPETVETGMGRVEAQKYERLTDRPGRSYLIWFSEDHRMMPVKYEYRRDGTVITFVMQSVEFGDT